MSNKKKVKEAVKEKTLIYCGPSFPGELQQYSVFKGGIPTHVKKHIEACPSIAQLLVGISEFPKVRGNLHVTGKREHQLFQSILRYQKEVR